VKTNIEISEKTNHRVFVLGWPIGSFPEVSVWIAAAFINTSFSAWHAPRLALTSLENLLVPR
jgi:hypothetical protein